MRYALRRYRWFIVLVTIACVGLGVLVTRVVRPVYTADTMLWIDGGTRRDASTSGPVRPQQVFDAEAWTSLLRSYAVLEGAVVDAGLFVNAKTSDAASLRSGIKLGPEYTAGGFRLTVDEARQNWTLRSLSAASTAGVEQGAIGDSVGRQFGLLWRPSPATLWAGRDLRFSITPPRQAAADLRAALDIRIDEEANFLTVALAGPDPQRLTATLNALGDRFVTKAAELKQENIGAYSGILSEQVASAQASLVAAERALQEFRVRTATIPLDMESVRGSPGSLVGGSAPDGATGRGEVYYSLLTSLETSRRERAALDAALDRASAGSANGGANTELALPALQRVAAMEQASELSDALMELTVKRNELRALRYRYEDPHPPIQRLLGEIATLERVTIPALARETSQRMLARENALAPRLAATVATLREIPSRDREEARLRRDVLLAGQLYESLQMRYDGTRIAEESAVSDVRVLDRAVAPVVPTKDNQMAILLFAFVGGLVVSGALAVLMDKADKRFRYPDQVTKDLGLTIIGAVPHLKAEPVALVRQRTSTPFQEAMRDVRLNLAYAHGQTGPLHVTITSPGSHDGKSFLAAHLARTFADSGARTLLIDGDLRRGQLNEKFNHPRRPGLSEYLRGTQEKERVILSTAIDRLDLIACGGRHRDVTELIGSPAMRRLLADVHDNYDVVICDSPPLSAGVDSVLLGAATGNILLVVRTGVSQREVAAARLEVIGRLPVRVIGAVLNDVPDTNAYSYYSHYSLPGYEARSEEDLVTVDGR